MTPWLETERLVLREPSDADVDAVWCIHGDPRTYAHLPSARVRQRSEATEPAQARRRASSECACAGGTKPVTCRGT